MKKFQGSQGTLCSKSKGGSRLQNNRNQDKRDTEPMHNSPSSDSSGPCDLAARIKTKSTVFSLSPSVRITHPCEIGRTFLFLLQDLAVFFILTCDASVLSRKIAARYLLNLIAAREPWTKSIVCMPSTMLVNQADACRLRIKSARLAALGMHFSGTSQLQWPWCNFLGQQNSN
jgi:hypothetical protein